eukprot:GFUD01033459.1.p1 GENE.GFUD01033459.1~~GFUD01033459.1.p1  ORF type:complete len:1179 (+),score=455.09 GFUD01033459.1:297-3539(+)
MEGLKKKNEELEAQLLDALEKLSVSVDSVVVKCNHEDSDIELKARVEQLEAELEVTKDELRMRQVDVNEEKDLMTQQMDTLRFQSDIASTLKSENELLNQDNQTLEEELAVARAEREKVELELVDMRQVRKDLELKFKEEDAKNVFLHFTQEQLNSQVLSLEAVVKNLKTENHLLNKGISNLIVKVQSEKNKFEEISEQYNIDNADSEQEFIQLQADLNKAKQASKNLEVDLRAKLGESEVVKNELKERIQEVMKVQDELKKDLEVSENDKTVLKDTFEATDAEKNNMALDLAEVSKQKMLLETINNDHLTTIGNLEKVVSEAKNDTNEIEMSKAGLEGEVCSLREEVSQLEESNYTMREEVSQLEVNNCDLRDQVTAKTESYATLEAHFAEQENNGVENKNLVKKLEELHELSQQNVENLQEELAIHKTEQTKLEYEISDKLGVEKEMTSQIEALESERDIFVSELNEIKVSKEEVEESLLETQGLVEEMEFKLSEAHSKHREEATGLAERLRQVNITLEDCKGERASLLEMNTSLSGQVAEALHSIHDLQVREDSLQQEVGMVKQFMEAAQEDGEQDRIRIMQAEDEILSLQSELDETLIEMEELSRRARFHAEKGEHSHQMVDRLSAELAAVREDLGAQLDTIKSAYNSAVAQLSESKTVGGQLLDQLNKVEAELETKQAENERLMKDFQDRNQEALDDMSKSKENFDEERKLLKENVTHLESLRDNLEKSLSAKTEVLYSSRQEVAESKEMLNSLEIKNEEIVKTNLRLKGNLEVRVNEVTKLKEEVVKKDKEIHTERASQEFLKAEQISGNGRIAELLEQNADLNRLRTAELEMCVELRERLSEMQTVAEEGESAKRSMEAQQVVLVEAEGRAEEAMLALGKWREKLQEAEEMMKGMEERMEQLEEEARYHREQHQLLQEMVEPFKEQLEGFEMEKRALLSQSEAAQGEVKKLATQYGSLLGHQNHQQKIQHVVKIKQENVVLKTEVSGLKEQLSKSKRANSRLEERLNDAMGLRRFDPRLSFQPTPIRNKENSMVSTPAAPGSKGVFQTPQGPPAGGKQSRQSTGSPLARVNRH